MASENLYVEKIFGQNEIVSDLTALDFDNRVQNSTKSKKCVIVRIQKRVRGGLNLIFMIEIFLRLIARKLLKVNFN